MQAPSIQVSSGSQNDVIPKPLRQTPYDVPGWRSKFGQENGTPGGRLRSQFAAPPAQPVWNATERRARDKS
jgi:hypothetical protein